MQDTMPGKEQRNKQKIFQTFSHSDFFALPVYY